MFLIIHYLVNFVYMKEWTLIGTVTIIHLLAAMSPGPDFFMAVRNSLMYSRKTGIWTAVGFGLGIGIHILYSILGLALLISKSVILFNLIKTLGAFYLMYLGVKSFFSKKSSISLNGVEKEHDISPFQAIKTGFLTNVLNPKATLFFLSLFTLVIGPDTPGHVLLFVSFIMMVNTFLWFALVSVFFTQKHVRRIYERFQNIFNKIFGGVLILIGIKLLLTRNK